MIGKTVSHYRIIEKLGEGGMGVVYRAEDLKLQRTVALKFLAPHALGGAAEKARFLHEARAAAALTHPNICHVYEIDEAEGNDFMAMEYVEGESLKERIEAGPLRIEEAIDIAVQVAEGLRKAHEKGIVHRDIKPANILVTIEGQAKIMDFGLAKSAKRTVLTQAGTTLGTVAYMSPEQTRGEEVDSRSDIWSLGAVLYEMVTGQRAFKADYEQAVVYSILNATPEPPSALRTGVPMELERIVVKCMERDPGERYQTAADLLADLRHHRRTMASAGRERAPDSSEQAPGSREQTVAGLGGLGEASVGAAERGRSGPAPAAPRPSRRMRPWIWVTFAILAVAIAFIVFRPYFAPVEKGPAEGRKTLVVLPFENLGPAEDGYFADGMTEEITSRLAALKGLGVVSRTSAFQYRSTDKTIKTIGAELGVDYVLEGTVRWERLSDGESRVRVTPQLIRVSDDTHLWSERYDHELKEIFDVQSRIAERVIDELNITLLEPELRSMAARQTENLGAYEAYLRGLEYKAKGLYSEQNRRLVVQMFERAVELDPAFALAYAELSKAHSNLVNLGMDPTQERIEKARAAAEEALALNPDLPEAHLALGYFYYWCLKDYDRALEEFDAAAEGLPNECEILKARAWIKRRQGRWEEALANALRAFELSPRNSELAREIGVIYHRMRRYVQADEYFDKSISLSPDQLAAYAFKAGNYWAGWGDLERSREVLEAMPERVGVFSSLFWCWQEALERDYEAALGRLADAPQEMYLAGDTALPMSLFEGSLYQCMDKPELAKHAYESAKALLERELSLRPDDHRLHGSLGLVHAALGHKEKAIEEGKLAVELYPVSKDALHGPTQIENLAQIYTLVGEYDAAMDQIEYLLSIPAELSVPMLRIGPKWDPLRGHPRFERLLERYSENPP